MWYLTKCNPLIAELNYLALSTECDKSINRLAEELIAAKEQLVKDTDAMKLDSMPRLPRRRDCENRDQREVDDIFTFITALDERGAVKQLPPYVCDNSDYVPSARLEDIDMRILLFKLEKIGDDVADTESGILKIQANVAFHGDDSSQAKLRPPFKSAPRVDCSRVGDRETVKKQVGFNQPPGIQSTETASNSLKCRNVSGFDIDLTFCSAVNIFVAGRTYGNGNVW